jgi:DNA-directed RNA polymerase subunit RPC12/RpoP
MNKNEFGISESLDKKIQMIIEEGEISDDDRLYIHECANEEGVSERDVDFYMNRLIKQKQKQKGIVEKEVEYEKKKKEAIGNICPKCGKQIPPMSIACPYCGTQVVSKKGVSSAQELLDKIQSIKSSSVQNGFDVGNPVGSIIGLVSKKDSEEDRDKKVREAIVMYPVPNTKEDIIEFLAIAAGQLKQKVKLFDMFAVRFLLVVLFTLLLCNLGATDVQEFAGLFICIGLPICVVAGFLISRMSDVKEASKIQKDKKAWRSKFNQVLMKGRSITGDTEFQRQLDYYENAVK